MPALENLFRVECGGQTPDSEECGSESSSSGATGRGGVGQASATSSMYACKVSYNDKQALASWFELCKSKLLAIQSEVPQTRKVIGASCGSPKNLWGRDDPQYQSTLTVYSIRRLLL